MSYMHLKTDVSVDKATCFIKTTFNNESYQKANRVIQKHNINRSHS